MEISQLVQGAMRLSRLGQVEFALVMNVSQAAVSQWVSGRRRPGPEMIARLERVHRRVEHHVLAAPWIKPIIVPTRRWDMPAFQPEGEFVLPVHIHWSGTPEQRKFCSADTVHRAYAYTQVIAEGTADDFARWIDLDWLASHFDDIFWPTGWKDPWQRALDEMGVGVSRAAV